MATRVVCFNVGDSLPQADISAWVPHCCSLPKKMPIHATGLFARVQIMPGFVVFSSQGVHAVDDKVLLQLLVTGIGEDAVAAQMNVSPRIVHERVRKYLEAGILKCNGESEAIDWKAFGQWKKQREARAVEAA